MKLYKRQRLQEEDPKDGKQKMFENIRKINIIRRIFRIWKRKIEDVQECMKDEDYKKKIQKMAKKDRRYLRMYERQILQEEDPKDDSVKDKQKMSKNIQKMKIIEDVPAAINDEDVRQCSKTSYDIESHQTVVQL